MATKRSGNPTQFGRMPFDGGSFPFSLNSKQSSFTFTSGEWCGHYNNRGVWADEERPIQLPTKGFIQFNNKVG
jgi:hypothetical protein